MALKASVYKVSLNISDMNNHHYETHALTVAKHPSETDERVMVRLLAYALNAAQHPTFTRGLSTDDEPDVWVKSLSDEIELWLDVGQPSEERLRKAAGRAQVVKAYAYASDKVQGEWADKLAPLCQRFKHLKLFGFDQDQTQALSELASTNMQLQCTIDGDDLWLSDDETHVALTLKTLSE